MKTQIKRFSKSALAVVLTLCMLVSCMTVGIIATDAAKTSDERVGALPSKIYFIPNTDWYNSGNVVMKANFNNNDSSWNAVTMTLDDATTRRYSVDVPSGVNKVQFLRGSTGTWKQWDYSLNQTIPTDGKNLFTLNSGWSGTDGTWSTFDPKTPLTAPTISYSSSTKQITWSNVSNASSYDVYKDGNLYAENQSSPYTVSTTGSYTVVAKPASGSTTYSQSTQSNAVVATINLTFYVCNSDNWSDIYYHVYTGGTSYANWPGTQITSTQIGTISGTGYSEKPVYEVSVPDNYTHIILHNNGGIQYKGDSKVALTANKLYFTTTKNQEENPSTIANFDPATMLDAIKYDVTFTPSPSNGTVKVNDSSTSPVKVEENKDFTILAKPNSGYTVDTVKVGTTTLTAQSGGSDSAGYTYTYNVGTAAKTVTVTFKAKTYTVTLNNNSGTGGTPSVTATYNSAMPSATMPTRAGYTFAGYYDTSAATGGTQYYKANGTSNKNWNKTADTTLYARWTEVTGGAVAKAYTSGSASDAGGTVKVGTGTPSASVNLQSIGITSSNTVTATKNTNYSFTGWQFSGTKAANLRYRFGTSGDWLTPEADTTYGTASDTTIYIKTDGTSGITNANAEVRALFVPTDYTGLTVGAQYTENGSTYTDFATTPSGVTIDADHGTNQTGVAVKAPATDPTGYVFAGWYSANGGFANNEDKDTTFKPNAANAKAIARYKKIYTLASSVDSTGTGAGTVSISITNGKVENATDKILAGGSYKITATAKNGSAIESIKVNNDTGTTTSPRTVNTVSANQTVSVKFASKPHVIGKVAAAGWTEPGDAMKSNAAGTEFTYTSTELAIGTYDFQHYLGTGAGGTYDSTSTDIATKNLCTGASLSAVNNGYGGKKFQLDLTVKATVTLVSNGSKFTSITVRRADGTKYAVTFKKADNTTITGQYEGTNFSTASADATVQVYAGDEINYKVEAADEYYIKSLEGVSGFTANTTYNGTLTVNAATTVTPTAAQLLSITAKSNKSDRGTVQVDAEDGKAYPGQIVKVTVTPKNGVLKSLTVKDASGAVVQLSDSAQTSSLNYSQLDVATVTALMYDFFNKSGEALGATANDEALGADTVKYFTMPDSLVTVSATFDPYSAESTWYYNGYDTSGNAVSGYHGKQMTEAMVGGEKFSYYEVSGRTGTDQLMTVSNGAASSGTRYVYFTASAEGGWSTDENHQYAYFYNDNGDVGNAWPGYKMTKYTTNDYGQKVYRVEIPTSSSPTGVVFNNASNAAHKTTNVTDLSKGGYYLLNTSHWDDTLQKTIHDWQSYDCTYPSAGYSTGTEYFYKDSTHNGDYTGDFNTKGFNNNNTASKEFAKPKDLGSNTGDYYINVLYPNTTYTINGVTKKTGSNPMIIWSAEPLAGDDETVKVYAKDGVIRAETLGSTYANIADTKIYAADGTTTVGTKVSGTITNQTYETYKAAKGDTIVIKTTIGATDSSTLSNAADLKAKYYVRGFCVNGEVSQLLEPTNDGVYTLTYKVPEDYEGKNIEITPIYYLKDTEANSIVTYRVTGFTDELKAVGSGKPGWGDTLYTYPFYGKLGGQNNAFGAYPGQPMVYYKGQYQMQIPQKSTAWDPYQESSSTVNNTNVSGVTMSNGYWDSVHKTIMGYGDNSSSADHVQTYDYGDFYKIFNEKKPVDNIVFDFKYRTKKHNFENQPAASIMKTALDTDYGTNGNGFELLTNFHGRNVDLFGTPLSGAASDPEQTTPVYVVSIGGVNGSAGVENIAGYYATEWMVYGSSDGSNYSRISAGGKNSIPPEVLVLNDDDTTSFNTTTYPSAVNTTAKPYKITDWKALYTALEAYRGKPVYISYEAADAQQGQEMYYTGTGGATRNDGRWLYSKNGENITSKIRVDVSHDSGATYVTNPAEGEGHVDGLSAYFTNADAYQKTTYATTIDPDKTFDFEAKTTNASYKFVGWFMEDGTKITSDNASHTERSGSYTFVARFMEVSSGQLVLSHSVGTGAKVSIDGHNYTCDGSGSASIGAVITDAETNEVLKTYDVANKDITIDEKYIGSDKNYNITVTLIAQADTNTAQGTTKLTNTSDTVTESEFFNPNTGTDSGKQRTFTFIFNVKDKLYSGTTQKTMSLIYNSYFIQYKFNYQINYTFKDRTGDTKQYKRIGTLTPAEANTYVKKVGSSRYLDKSFIEKMAPVESNFGQNISWTFDDYLISTGGEDGSNYEYDINAHYTATQTEIAKRNVTFVLPYAHDEYGVATLDSEGKGTKETSDNLEFVDKRKSDGSDERVTFAQIPVLKDNKKNGIYTEEEKSHWIAAPQTIKDDNKELTFRYWSIKTTDHCTAQDPDVSRCYFPGFNFIAYDNYVIEAIYGDTSALPSEYGKNTNITYVETTRNQWNSNGIDYSKTERNDAADLLYNDFIVSYSLDGKEIYSGEADNDIADIGIVVERIKALDTKQDGSLDTTLSKYTDIAERTADVDSVINGGTVTGFSRHSITKNSNGGYKLDNKDRYNIYDAFYNSAGWKQTTTGGNPAANYTYKNYVYRAYSYMKLTNGTIVKSSPAYFTMYDVATANYSSN